MTHFADISDLDLFLDSRDEILQKTNDLSPQTLYFCRMHDSRKNRRKFWAVVIFLIVGFLALSNSIDSGSSIGSVRFEKTETIFTEDCEEKFKEDGCIDAYVQILSFNTETKYME